MKTMQLVINPNAGTRQGRRFLPEIISLFNRAGWSCSVWVTEKRGDATAFARDFGGEAELIGLKIRAFSVDHGGIPCFGYRLTLERRPAFDPDKARALGVPVQEWKRLQQGETLRLGLKRIHPEDVTGERRKGITFVFSTDTRPCETLRKYASGADLLILEGMYGAEEKLPQALKNHHMLFPRPPGSAS